MLFAAELAALEKAHRGEKPAGWRLSPKAVEQYLLGGEAGGTRITPKYVGSARLVQVAIATLATHRALLLIGEPGTAKSWLSEHLAAAISDTSLMLTWSWTCARTASSIHTVNNIPSAERSDSLDVSVHGGRIRPPGEATRSAPITRTSSASPRAVLARQ